MMTPERVYHLSQDDTEEIEQLFLGKRIVAVDLASGQLTLDSGTTVTVEPNEGGCVCSAGDYELTHLSTVDNVITDVTVLNDPSGDDSDGVGYRIFVFADAVQINAVQIDGDDGNGYYGTGYTLTVRVPNLIHEEPF